MIHPKTLNLLGILAVVTAGMISADTGSDPAAATTTTAIYFDVGDNTHVQAYAEDDLSDDSNWSGYQEKRYTVPFTSGKALERFTVSLYAPETPVGPTPSGEPTATVFVSVKQMSCGALIRWVACSFVSSARSRRQRCREVRRFRCSRTIRGSRPPLRAPLRRAVRL